MIECQMGKADLCIYKEWLEKDNGTCDEMIETDKTEWGSASSDFHDTCVMISSEGEDEPHCIHPSSKHGCQSLGYPFKSGMQKFCISGNMEVENEQVSLRIQNISYSIEYVMVIGIAAVSALKGYGFYMDSYPAYQIQLVTLVNITIIDSVFYVGGGDLVIKGSNLRNILITEPSHSIGHKYASILLEHSTFKCNDQNQAIHFSKKTVVKLKVTNSQIYGCTINLKVADLILIVSHSNIYRVHTKIEIRSFIKAPTVIRFTETNFYNSSLLVNWQNYGSKHAKAQNLYIYISECIFTGAPISIYCDISSMFISNSTFKHSYTGVKPAFEKYR